MTDSGNGTQNVNNMEIDDVSRIKISKFWTTNPTLWFVQLDAQFYNNKVKTDTAKYYAVLGSLDASVLEQICDLVSAPPPENKYEHLKEKMIERFSESEEKQLKKLLTELELGEKKPSQLLREMKTLAANKVNDKIVKTLWLQRLPSRLQMVLTVTDDVPLEQLACIADKIAEVEQVSSVNAISPSWERPVASTSSSEGELRATIADLQRQLADLKLSRRSNSQRRFRSRSRSRPRNGLCYFHTKFAANARKCRAPCNFQKSTQSPNQGN